ncbi:putative formin-like protein 5 [Iris pallida]|uniref:Formin-like protein 5 n=1 Tax=Iris pallida TaxID=29817 RepID=A0AAX6ET15_IRIPA|nr:putative formin-like protein 5 [Iris pallida]
MRIQTEGAHRTVKSESGGSTMQGRRSRRTEVHRGSPTRRCWGQYSVSGGMCLWWTRDWWSRIWGQNDVTSVSAYRHGHGVLMFVILWNKTGSTRTHGFGHGSGWLGDCGRKCG